MDPRVARDMPPLTSLRPEPSVTHTMRQSERTLRWTSIALVVFVTTAGVAIPVMDGDLGSDGPVVEAGHEPGACVVLHDHTLCIHFGANRWAPAPAPVPRLPDRSLRRLVAGPEAGLDVLVLSFHTRARAPPAG